MNIVSLAERVTQYSEPTKADHIDLSEKFGMDIPKYGTLKFLELWYLYRHMGRLVHKSELALYVIGIDPNASLDRQARHLRREYGLNVALCGHKAKAHQKVVPSGTVYYDIVDRVEREVGYPYFAPDGYYGLLDLQRVDD